LSEPPGWLPRQLERAVKREKDLNSRLFLFCLSLLSSSSLLSLLCLVLSFTARLIVEGSFVRSTAELAAEPKSLSRDGSKGMRGSTRERNEDKQRGRREMERARERDGIGREGTYRREKSS
jgi:hypothetical protein